MIIIFSIVVFCCFGAIKVFATNMDDYTISVDSKFTLVEEDYDTYVVKFKKGSSGIFNFAKIKRVIGVYSYYSKKYDKFICMSLMHIESAGNSFGNQSYNVPYDYFRHKSIMQSIDFEVDSDYIDSGDYRIGTCSPMTEQSMYTSSSGWSFGVSGDFGTKGASASAAITFSSSNSITKSTISYSLSFLNDFGRIWNYSVAGYEKNDNTEAKSAFTNVVMNSIIINNASDHDGESFVISFDNRVDYFIDEWWWEDYNISTSDSINNLDLAKNF